MIPAVFYKFISDLKQATNNNSLKWISSGEGSFYCINKTATIHLLYELDYDTGVSTIYFQFIENGKKTPFSVNQFESDYLEMQSLFESVIANANDVSDSLKNFF